jgi:N-formylglutamate deformylase
VILFHIPHSSTFIPEDERRSILLDDQELERELLVMTDLHLDAMAEGMEAERVVYPYSRLVADPERFRDDEDEVMSRVGMGAVYTRTHDGRPLRTLDPVRREELLRRYYDPHHHAMEQAVTRTLKRFGTCLIIDLHSYPTAPLPYELYKTARRPDLCLGTDPFHTPPWLIERVSALCQATGLSMVENEPFKGTFVPLPFYRKDPRVLSVMIELKRSLYMDERTGERNSGYEGVKAAVEELGRKLAPG